MGGGNSREAFGRWLKELRGDTKQVVLARELGISQSKVSDAERGALGKETAACYDRYFSAQGATARGEISARHHRLAEADPPQGPRPHTDLAALAQSGGGLVVVLPLPGAPQLAELLTGMAPEGTLPLPDGPYQVITNTGEAVDMAIDRRMFAASGVLVPASVLEQTRHGLLGSLLTDRSATDVDEWQEIIREYGHSYLGTPPTELLGCLQVDLTALGETLQRPHADAARCQLQKVAALLAVFTAQALADVGEIRSSRRWWRTAKDAADESGDIQARLWIRGQEVARALYEQRPMPVIFDLVAEAESISSGAEAPPAAMPFLLCGKAQALAFVGRGAEAETALGDMRDTFDRLPVHTTRDTDSWFGWPERKLIQTESIVYSHLGNFVRAEQARAAALALLPATVPRAPIKISLLQALCMVRTGDVAIGVEHAHTVMTGLPRDQHDRVIVDLGHKVLDAVPVAERGRDGVREFRSYLGREVA